MELVEADLEKFVPYAGHVRPDVIMHFDGTLHAMLHLRGTPFELEPGSVRNGREERINTLLRTLADPEVEVCIHLVRHQAAPPMPDAPPPTTDFVRQFLRDYERVALSDLFTNDWFISILLHPERPAKRRPLSRAKPLRASRSRIQTLNAVVDTIASTLSDYQPRRLGLIDEPLPITEIGGALYLIRTAHQMPIPHTWGSITSAIYTEPCVFKAKHFEPNIPGVPRLGAMHGFNNYPAMCRVGMFNTFLGTPYPVVMSHSFRYHSVGSAVKSLALIRAQMRAAHDAAINLVEGLTEAMKETSGLRTASGQHTFALAVYADDRQALDKVVADAHKRLSLIGGAAPIREMSVWYNGAQEASYYGQLPGSGARHARSGVISTRDLASMATLDNYPTGAHIGYWGASPIRFKTNGGTAYDFVTHDEDVAHALVIGRMGAGKTALLGTMAAVMEPVVGADGIRLIIDKDESNRLLVEACGGTHQKILRNQPSGVAPLLAFANTPRSQSFLHQLYTWLIMLDGRGPLDNDADQRLKRGIERQLAMPPEKRGMSGVREFLGYTDPTNGAGARFERYCRGGSMGWLLDNSEHVIAFGPGLYAFDFTAILPREGQADDGACQTVAAVIMHQLGELMDGRRIACFFDECRFYIEPLRQMIEDYSLTGRKKELMLWLAAQQPEHFTGTSIGQSLVAQMRTKIIFPGADYNEEELAKLQLTPAAIRMLKTDMTLGAARRFLLWRAGGPTICEFDLSSLPQLPLLAGRPGTISLMERVRSEHPEPTAALSEFYRRLDNIKRAA